MPPPFSFRTHAGLRLIHSIQSISLCGVDVKGFFSAHNLHSKGLAVSTNQAPEISSILLAR